MADNLSKQHRKKTMQAVKSSSTRLEKYVTKKLWGRGLRFNKNVAALVGKPDIAIKKYRMVIFLDSCFWHGCPYHSEIPKTNRSFWKEKISRNRANDKKVTRWYKTNKWEILRYWGHSVNKRPDKCIKEILELAKTQRRKYI